MGIGLFVLICLAGIVSMHQTIESRRPVVAYAWFAYGVLCLVVALDVMVNGRINYASVF